MNLWDELKKDVNALPLIADWVGAGHPVSQHTAEMRASICAECPKNKFPNWWEQIVKLPISETIKSQMELKHRMELSTSKDEEINVCGVCKCVLNLKVWVPIEHIKEHMADGELEKFPKNCWLPPEIESLNSTKTT